MDESAVYSPDPSFSPKSRTRRSISRFNPGGGSSNRVTSPPQRDPQPVASTSNGPGVEDPLPASRFRRGASPLSTRSLIMSDSEKSEILSPIPRKHINITAQESLPWLRTETPSPAPSNLSNYSAVNMATNHMRTSLASPPIHSHSRLISITGRSRKPSSVGSLPEGTRGGGTGRSAAMTRLMADRYAKEHGGWEGGFARRWIRWMHKEGIKRWILPCVLLATMWIKWATGLGSYSGRNSPPMFGDYEAQRHWMEITIHLPFQQWYKYDLRYWGLDYPPLTAYVSWFCGKVGFWIEPSWFVLDASRGIETDGSKVFLRATVLFCDLLYVWAVVMFTQTIQATRSTRTRNLTIVILLMQPALLLIDFGHFQYNCVMLALTLLSVNYMSQGRDLIAAIFFVASLGFKQMALYYAPAIGSYLLAKCVYLGQKKGVNLFVQLGAVTIISFVLLFLPFLPPFASPATILDPVTRIFPFARGLFEDKVANFWCFSNVVLKWRNLVRPGTLVRLSTLLTAAGFLPAVVGMLSTGFRLRTRDGPTIPSISPGVPAEEGRGAAESAKAEGDEGDKSQRNGTLSAEPGPLFPIVLFSMLTTSMSFFLFSFQVHEKTILVPLLPLTLIMVGSTESTTWELGMLTNNVAVFSMWPLLKRDGLGVQYVALTTLWNTALGYTPFKRPKTPCQFLSLVVSVACVVLHFLEIVVQPPARYPDLFPVLNVLVSTPVFGLVWLWSIKSGIQASWAIAGLGGTAHVGANSYPTPSSSVVLLKNAASLTKPHSRSVHHGDTGPQISTRDPPLSPLLSFNRRIGSPSTTLGPSKPGVRGRTWSSASANSNTKARGNIPAGLGWDRPLSLDRTERAEGGRNVPAHGLGLGLDGRGDNPPDKKRGRVQSLGVTGMRKRGPNPSGGVEGLPPPSD